VLSTQFLDYMFKLSINWPVAVVLSTFNWKSGKKIDFQLKFISSIVFVYAYYSMASRSHQQNGAVFLTDAKPVY
jgi:hypothetical protein